MTILSVFQGKKNQLCINSKAAVHLHVMSQTTETIGLLVLKYSLINPDIPYEKKKTNTDCFIPIDSISKAELSFFLHQAVVCGCSGKRAQAPVRNGAS